MDQDILRAEWTANAALLLFTPMTSAQQLRLLNSLYDEAFLDGKIAGGESVIERWAASMPKAEDVIVPVLQAL